MVQHNLLSKNMPPTLLIKRPPFQPTQIVTSFWKYIESDMNKMDLQMKNIKYMV